MADKKYDGVIEAVHYRPDGQVDWVRAYLRRGPTWSDRVIMLRDDVINEIKSGRKMRLGQRVQFMAGTFEVSHPVQVVEKNGQEYLLARESGAKTEVDLDLLEGAPVI